MNTLETRIANLERTNRHYRSGLSAAMAMLAIVAVAGFDQIRPGQTQTYPRNIVADSITVQTLSSYSGTINNLGSNTLTTQSAIVGDAQFQSLGSRSAKISELQCPRAELGKLKVASASVVTSNGIESIVLTGNASGGSVSLMDATGKVVALLSTRDMAGLLQLAGKGGFQAFEATGDDKSGQVKTFNNFGKTLASLGHSDKGDGELIAHTRNGNRAVILSADETAEYGRITVQKQGGAPLVVIDADEKGGIVKTFDGSRETSRLPLKQP